MRSAEEMDQADEELRETVKQIWPLQAKKILDLLIPRNDELGKNKLTVGKIYGGLLILESWRSTRFGQLESSGPPGFGGHSPPNEAPGLDDTLGSRRQSMDSMQDQSHLHPQSSYRHNRPRSRSPSIRRRGLHDPPDMARSPSPRRFPQHSHHPHPHSHHPHHHHHHDIGFSDTVSNVVEIVKHEHSHTRRHPHIRGSWSASTSPARSPSPSQGHIHMHRGGPHGVYGTTSLEQRSRSPSPRAQRHQHSYPVLVARRGQGRRLPPTPSKPSTLQLHPSSINFPKLNPSPTHLPPHYAVPLSFEQAVAIGRGGRMLPSPVPNGYKPQPLPLDCGERHSDSDDDDWC